jgi:hypothetical protein
MTRVYGITCPSIGFFPGRNAPTTEPSLSYCRHFRSSTRSVKPGLFSWFDAANFFLSKKDCKCFAKKPGKTRVFLGLTFSQLSYHPFLWVAIRSRIAEPNRVFPVLHLYESRPLRAYSSRSKRVNEKRCGQQHTIWALSAHRQSCVAHSSGLNVRSTLAHRRRLGSTFYADPGARTATHATDRRLWKVCLTKLPKTIPARPRRKRRPAVAQAHFSPTRQGFAPSDLIVSKVY